MMQTTAVHRCRQYGQHGTLKVLLRAKTEQNVKSRKGLSPLMIASSNGHSKCCKYLIKFGTNLNACKKFTGNSSLCFASEKGHITVVKILIENGGDVCLCDKWKLTALHRASKNGHREMVQYLISNGSDPNWEDQWGCTPLHRAAENGHLDTVSFLIEHSSRVTAEDKWMFTPLDTGMGDHQGKIPGAVLLGKSGWRSKHQSRLPPLLQMLFVD